MAKAATKTAPTPAANGEPQQPPTSLIRVPEAAMTQVRALEELSLEYQRQLENDATTRLVKSVITAATIQRMGELLTDEIMGKLFMPLMNSELGFKTDRPVWKDGKEQKPAYNIAQVRRVLIWGFLRGAYPLNNELNIISGQGMLVKNYFIRAIREFPGVSGDPDYSASVVRHNMGKQFKVRAFASCRVNGRRLEIRDDAGKIGMEFDVTAFDGAADALIGKAERRGLRALLRLLNGRSDDDDEPAGDIPAEKQLPAAKAPAPQDSDRQRAMSDLGRAIEDCRKAGRFTDAAYADCLQQFGVKKTADLKTEDVPKVANLVNELAKPVPAERHREPGDDDQETGGADVPDDSPAEFFPESSGVPEAMKR